ncbi:hypothetical protein DNTS_003557 [Danionella cerebrum]|uniref:[histone H3]-trimethyl-L-lysine(9) demethylase n=1 Tax=Danionella cerebrum TaxID=2873325 RepID=A0A553Q5N9_9TELE|nr:hypothetical protein DNTS_003557 [Danionella translucida]
MASDTSVYRGIMTFYPTVEEFKNFSRYIAYMESQGAHKAGLAKIVPPKNWKPRDSYDDIDDLVIPAPIQQVVTGQSGLFTQYNIQKKAMTLKEFRKAANSDKYDDFEELERKYWKNVTFNPPIYGADGIKEWNIGCLNTILDTVEHESGITIEGVNTPYLYFGMWKTTSQNCEAFLRHKMTLISPSILKKYGIPFERITQEAGEFMVTFPYGYHAGFNHGFNCAESTNFATRRWIDYGKQAILCSCRKDMVKISMDVFVRKFQPERYKLWLAGKDNAPIDHNKPTPEATEFLGEEAANQEPCIENQTSEGQKKSPAKQRIGTKRHRVCLDLPEEVLPKSEIYEEGAEYGKKLRLTPFTQHCREDAASKFTDRLLPLTCSTSLKALPGSSCADSIEHASCGDVQDPTRSLECSQPFPKHHLSIASIPSVPHSMSALPRPSTKPGVASLLFHRTLDSSDALQVHSYAAKSLLSQPQQASPEKPREDVKVEEVKLEEGPNTVTPPPNAEHRVEGNKENSSMKRQLQPLSNLPRFHPLLRENSSDEEIQEPTIEPEETDLWGQLLAPMWQSKPRSFKVEKDFNLRMGQYPPYCAVCSLFHTYTENDILKIRGYATEGVAPHKSKPLIPEMCFTSSSEGTLSTPNLEDDGSGQLISCSVCCVRVHTSCYGVPRGAKLDGWRCSRCEANAFTQDCCLCSLRGGALQRANHDKWVHVLCSVAILEARFVNIAERRPVELSSVPLDRFRLRNKASMGELEKGQKVICKHKNSRYYHCEVTELTKATFYEVIFDDGSFSDNLFPEDIVNRDCQLLGPPAEGDVVQVLWTDGLIYGAKFVSDHIIPMYQVEFEDNSQLTVKREELFSLNEELPKRVKARLSVASDMRFKEVFVEKEVKQDSKRQRVVNSRYREDYIEPSVYRAIME